MKKFLSKKPLGIAGDSIASEKRGEGVVPANDSKIEGFFDKIEGGAAQGWAMMHDAPTSKLTVEIVEDGKLIGLGQACLPRVDLVNARVGDGHCGFHIPLPRVVYDGKEHLISARVSGQSMPLIGSPKTLLVDAGSFRAEVTGFDGASLVIRAFWGGSLGTLPMIVCEGPEKLAQIHVEVPPPGQPAEIRVPLPRQVLDGRPHWFRVCLAEPDLLIGQAVVVTPCVVTSETFLQKYAHSYPSYLSASAAQRYESLRQQLASALQDQERTVTPLDPLDERLFRVCRAHEQLLRGFNRSVNELEQLSFPGVHEPRVSVVIPVHNKLGVTYNCLASLVLACNKAAFEVIVVDDGSTDETTELEKLVTGITVLRHETAKGFVHSCNHGAEAARGDYVVMLDNDTEVSSGWIDEMLAVFENFDKVGLVGSMLLYPDGRLQEAGGVIFRNANAWNYGRNENAHDPRFNYVRQVDYVSGACMMVSREIWRELGGFDIAFAPGYYEDTDLAYRVRAKGFKTMYTPFSRVIHFERVSSGTSLASGMKRYPAINEPKFRSRWATAIRAQDSSTDPDLVKDRGIALRALVIDAETPQPDKDAGSYAALQEIKLLQALGFKITFIPQNLAYLGSYTETLQRMGVECLYAPYASVEEVIARRGGEFDIVYITRYAVAQGYIDLIRESAPQAKIIFNNADLHFLREIRASIAQANPELMRQAITTREAELAVMRRVDLVLSYTDNEHAVVLSHNLDSTRIAKAPWVTRVPENVPGFEARDGVAYLGNFRHGPNAEAVTFFVTSVIPLLARRLPGVRFYIFGSHIPDAIHKLKDDNVVVKGYVKNTSEAYDGCRVFVAPLLSGAGIKGKVVEALARGVPTVLSPIAAEGVGARSDLEVVIAETPSEWVAAIASLYEDERRWKDMSLAAQAFVAREFNWERGIRLMQAALQRAGVYVGETGVE